MSFWTVSHSVRQTRRPSDAVLYLVAVIVSPCALPIPTFRPPLHTDMSCFSLFLSLSRQKNAAGAGLPGMALRA